MKRSHLLGAVCAYLAIVSVSTNADTFDSIVVNNEFIQPNGVSHSFINGLTVNGSWKLNATSSSTDMSFNGTQTIGGTGEIDMSDSPNNRILGNNNPVITIDNGMTIRGAGSIGLNIANLNNQGAILAQGDNAELLIRSTSFTNNGVLRAEGLKGLTFSSVNLSNNTSVDINTGSALSLVSSRVNGIFNISDGATATTRGTTFDAVTINGDIEQSSNLSANLFENGLTLNGSWNVSGGSDMGFKGSQTIGGAGEIVMSDDANNRILGNNNPVITIDNGMTIRGAGSIGLNISNLNNQGTISAQGDNAELLIRSTSFSNDGTLVAEGVKGMNPVVTLLLQGLFKFP